jgi:uncharacterized membrane protein
MPTQQHGGSRRETPLPVLRRGAKRGAGRQRPRYHVQQPRVLDEASHTLVQVQQVGMEGLEQPIRKEGREAMSATREQLWDAAGVARDAAWARQVELVRRAVRE